MTTRRRISVPVISGTIALVLLNSLPSYCCVCANGSFKFFCDGPATPKSIRVAAEFTESDCCRAKKAVETRGCCGPSEHKEREFSQGCKRVARQPNPARLSDSLHNTVGSCAAFFCLSFEPASVSSTSLDASPNHAGAGPPVDLVIQLHRILI